MVFRFFALPLLAFLLSAGLTPVVRRAAIGKGWIAHPSDDRWHKTPTALMGGITIFAAFIVPTLMVAEFVPLLKLLTTVNGGIQVRPLAAVLAIGALFLFVLGLYDDVKNIKPYSKLIGQIVAASVVTFLGFRLNWFTSLTLDTMATLFWIVGITNAFNLIDNMDGLCAGVGLVASLCLAVLYADAAPQVARLALILAGAQAGFLIYNFNPAKIFMGDCGSLVIGFVISVLALFHGETKNAGALSTLFVPILVLLVPILDTSLVTVIRILSGRKASTGGRDHTSHRLVLMGFSERTAVLFLYGVAATAGMAAVFVDRSDTMTSPAVIVPALLAIVLMGVYLSQLRVYPEKEFSVLRNRSFTPVLLELTYKRHLVLVCLDFILIAFAYYLAYRLRFSGKDFSYYFPVFLKSLPVVIACKLLIFFIMGVYRGIWSYISTNDVLQYLRASLVATLITVAVLTFIYRFKDFSKGLFMIDWLLTTGLLLASRGSFRMFVETQKRKSLAGDKVVIYGAGRGGELLLREILNNHRLKVNPIGFIDDDSMKKGKKIQGYPILGSFSDLAGLLQKYPVDGILISFNHEQDSQWPSREAVHRFCREKNLFVKQFQVALRSVDIHGQDRQNHHE